MPETLKIYKKSYRVNIPVFEGPLDLLLYLIQKQELDIYDIPISQITHQYVEYIEMMELLDLEVAGEFLVMAATLMEIKSKMLLPPDPTEVNQTEDLDPRAELVERLLEYQRFKEAGLKLEQLEAIRKDYFSRKPAIINQGEWTLENEDQWWNLSLYDLVKAMSRLIQERPPESVQQIFEELITVEGKIQHLLELLGDYPILFLSKTLQGVKSRLEVITTVLAVLELAKISQIHLEQKELFGEIQIVRVRIEQPRSDEVKISA